VRTAVGLSTVPDARAAAAEAASLAREPLAATPTLAVLVTSPQHAAQAAGVLDAVHEVAQPDALVGCVVEAVVAGRRELEGGPAVVVWLAALPRPAETFHLEFIRTPSGGLFAGHRFDAAAGDPYLLLADPYTFPTQPLFAHLNAHVPGTTVMGGLVGGGGEAGRTRLFWDRKVIESGAVGVRLPGLPVRPVVSQGCRPIGAPCTVTGAQGPVVTGLAGRPPLRLLEEILAGLPPHEQVLVSRGLHLGLAIDEYKAEFGRGDFLIRAVTGADPESGAVQVGDIVEVGTTAQFQVRDAATADEDLRESLLRARAGGRPAGALLFTCNGRGSRMFDVPDHDAAVVSELLDGTPVAGFFAAGEFGPVAGKNFLHGFTASLALFVDEDG
jgi:small ligand-binding sensory domain FIST